MTTISLIFTTDTTSGFEETFAVQDSFVMIKIIQMGQLVPKIALSLFFLILQVNRRIDPKTEMNCNYETLNLNTVPERKSLHPSQYPETTTGPRTELGQSGFKSRSGYGAELIRTGLGLPSGLRSGPPQRSRFGFELRPSSSAVSVPHPEHNPIPEPILVALKNLNNRQVTDQIMISLD